MPVIRDIPLSLETVHVLRREGVGGRAKIRAEIERLVLELLSSVKKEHLLEPAIAYEIYPVTGMRHRQVSLEGGRVLSGALIPSTLPEAKELAIVVGTIGAGLEKQVTDYNNRQEPLRGVLLDGIGSAAVDSLSQEACKIIEDEASSRDYRVSSPVSPGMPGLPIAEQWPLLALVPAGEIGVSLTSSGVMVPRKSTSMVMGIGTRMSTWTRAEVCARCNLRKTCHYKIAASAGSKTGTGKE